MPKGKLISTIGSISGVASFLGSWQICHTVCLALIAILGVLGITVAGMPLQFLTAWAVPLWSTAVALLAILLVMHAKMKCISRSMLMLNTGIIIAGIPFYQAYVLGYWITGGLLVASALALLIMKKYTLGCH